MLLKEFTRKEMQVLIHNNRGQMGKAAAAEVSRTITLLLETREEVNIIFGAAPSQQELLAGLVSDKTIPWNRINGFQMDEYTGLSREAPQRFGNFLKRHIFSHCGFKELFYLEGDTVPEAIERYQRLLQEHPADIVLLGIGENGHIAFNDPHTADFQDPQMVKEVTLDRECRMQQVHDGCFSALEEVPEKALTLTIPALMQAEHAFCTVPSALKRRAVSEAVNGEISTGCPASILQNKKGARLFLDRESGADLL